LGGSLLMGLAGAVRADTSDADLRAEVQRLNSRLAEVESQQNANWLTERRSEEIKGLIRDVLADADTRASLLQDGGTAGHNGKNFYAGSANGEQLLTIWGQVQFQYLFNLENLNAEDQEDEGFQIRRTKLGFDGHVTAGGRKYTYTVVIALDRGDGNAFFEDIIVGTAITDNISIRAGHFKLPFTREELGSSKNFVAGERSTFNEFFTGNRAEQVQVGFTSDMFKVLASLSDGFNSGYTVIGGDGVEIAITGRVDVKLMGDWDQDKDMVAWQGEPMALFLGAALHFEAGDGPNGQAFNFFTWTIDGVIEVSNFSFYAAIAGGHTDPDAGSTVDQIGFVLMATYNINDQFLPFVRFDWIDDDISADELMTITFGVTIFLAKHQSKVTLDVVWVADGSAIGVGSVNGGGLGTGEGFSAGDTHGEDNFIFRLTYQLLF
jgi:hypothetical protein